MVITIVIRIPVPLSLTLMYKRFARTWLARMSEWVNRWNELNDVRASGDRASMSR